MQNKKLSFGERLKVAFTGEAKAYIPSLPSDSLFDGVDIPLAQYKTKPEQLRANIGWVFAANDAIAPLVASVPLKLRKRVGDEYEEITSHDILDLLKNPSKAHDGETLRELHHSYLNLTGESYLRMIKAGGAFVPRLGQLPDALQIMPSHLTQFTLGKTRYSDSTVKYGQETYKLDEVIRDFIPDLWNPYEGRSYVTAAASAISLDENMQSWNGRMFQNNGRPGMVVSLDSDSPISPDTFARVRSQLQELYSGDNAFKTLVLENGQVKPFMLSPTDLDFLASREFTKDEILAIFKTPAAVLGMIKDFNRANMDAAIYIHMFLNIVPRLRKEVRMWNNNLVQVFDPALEVYFDNPIPEDIDAKLAQAKAGTNLWMLIDEVRELYGLEPLPDDQGQQLYVPGTSVPLSKVVEGTDDTTDTTGANDSAASGTDNEDDGEDETNPEGKKSLPKPRH